MKMLQKHLGHQHYFEYFFPALIILMGIVSTVLFAQYSFNSEHSVTDKTLTAAVDESADLISAKVDQYDLLSRATEGLFVSSDRVTRLEFHEYISNEIGQIEIFPEISSGGFFTLVSEEELDSFINYELQDQSLQSLGYSFETISVFPETENTQFYVTTHIEPLSFYDAFLGYDFTNEPIRTAAVTESKQTGRLTLTDQILLRSGHLGYVAVYPIEKENTQEELGLGFFVFRVAEMINSIFKEKQFENIDLIVYDREFPENLFYSTSEDLSVGSFNNKDYVEREAVKVANKTFVIEAKIQEYPFFFTTFLAIAFGFLSTAALSLLALYLVRSKILISHRQRDTRRSLQKAQRRFIGAFNASSVGMALVAPNGKWLDTNKALAEMVGYSQRELMSMNFQQITHEDDLDKDLGLLQQVIDDEIQTYQMEKRYIHRQGNIVWVMLNVSVVRNEDRSVDYFVSQIMDITNQKNQDQSKRDFISITSHQLRTPLTAVSWNIELLQPSLQKALKESEQKMLAAVVSSTKRMIELVNALLSTSRIDMDKIHINPEKINLHNLINQIVEDVRAASEHQVSINLQVIDLPPLFYDTKALTMVFQNLIANAAKFSPENGKVNIAVTTDGPQLIIEIRDNGIGIPDEEKGKVFEKFFRAENAKTGGIGGTGLGLYIVKAMIEKMGGTIKFNSRIGEGTTFTVSLPLNRYEQN